MVMATTVRRPDTTLPGVERSCHSSSVAGIDELLPRARTPVDYLNVVTDPRLDQAGLRALGASPYPFVRHAVPTCPRADPATLAAVVTDDLNRWTRNSILAAIARHPNADRPVLLTILHRTRALLDRPDERPFAAALALAQRPELSPTEILDLVDRRHSSRRMARGVRRVLGDRPT
jgi:hypothetical protein